MDFDLKLAECLGGVTRGTIAKIAARTGLSRSQVADMVWGRGKTVNKVSLSRIAAYLVQEGKVNEADLPAALFRWREADFWTLLANAERIEFCMGARCDPQWRGDFVIAADARLQAELVYRITSDRSRGRAGSPGGMPLLDMRTLPAPPLGRAGSSSVQQKARELYQEFRNKGQHKALLMLGSVKSNSAIELATANCFPRARAFRSEDSVAHAADRPCPFLVLYRDTDPKPPSVCGGLRLSQKEAGSGPGIYYETADGAWQGCLCDRNSDVGLVLYRLHRPTGSLEMVLGGYSSRGTACLARCLGSDETREFSPPCYSDAELDIGIFVLRFRFRGRGNDSSPLAPRPAAVEVIRLDPAVINRRLRKGTRRGQFPDNAGISPSAD